MMSTEQAGQPWQDHHEPNTQGEKDEGPRPELLVIVVPAILNEVQEEM